MPEITIKETGWRGKALLQLQDGRMIAYDKGQLLIYNAGDPSKRKIQLPLSFLKNVCANGVWRSACFIWMSGGRLKQTLSMC